MSEAAIRDRLRKQSWAAPGGAHDWLIGVMKIALPTAIGILAAYMAVVPLQKQQEMSFILDKNKVDVSSERLRIASARYRGQDNKGRPFSIDAQTAVQKTSKVPIVDISGMSAKLALETGPASLQANTAKYNMDTQAVNVIGPVTFATQDGYHLDTRDVAVDLNNRTLTGSSGVEGTMPLGHFTAQNLSADLADRRVVLSGRAHLHIVQSRTR